MPVKPKTYDASTVVKLRCETILIGTLFSVTGAYR